MDTKKKELIGDYANGGTEWSPEGEPERVQVHDFADRALGEFAKAIPYGIYDVANDEGWVSVGDVADTAEFAVESIRRWWNQMGRARFPDADRLLITADAGGSNGYRLRAWKVELARLAAETGLRITVCHYPPGTSKWNRIEHRMFSFITMNWRGRPLTSLRTIIELISATTTDTGLTVQAAYDPEWYAKGVKISDAELAAVPLDPARLPRRMELHHQRSHRPVVSPKSKIGYPSDKPLPSSWIKSGTSTRSPGSRYEHNLDVIPGDSGAGTYDNGDGRVNGIKSTQWFTTNPPRALEPGLDGGIRPPTTSSTPTAIGR